MTDLSSWMHARVGASPVRNDVAADPDDEIRALAFYLPQFHPIPENDLWWGKGFTEWTNVVRAKPLFDDHYQPHLPGELGFYDLRVPEVREQQADLARKHGLAGFCYYHYWFAGRRLLERPFQAVLESKAPNFPFCVCWANENWSRRWDGSEHEILIAQDHSPGDDRSFMENLLPALADDRYIRVDGKAVLLVYRAALLPNAAATAERWREVCVRAGVGDLFLCNMHSFDTADPRTFGFDAAVEFPPNLKPMPRREQWVSSLNRSFGGCIYEYDFPMPMAVPDYTLFRGVFPTWDNTCRRKSRGSVIVGSTPEKYGEWLADVCAYTIRNQPPERRLIFINAWNEWGEGCHLEPDARFGGAYLERTRDVLSRFGCKANEDVAVGQT